MTRTATRHRYRKIKWDDFAPPADVPDDQIWTPRAVETRLVEAARLCLRTGGPVLPRGIKGSMPDYAYDWGDLIGQADSGTIATDGNRIRRGATAREISRMEAAIMWPWRYLEKHEGPRGVLKVYLRCKALRIHFDEACRRRQWSRATAYRARDRALTLIALGLTRDRVPLDGDIDAMSPGAPRRATLRD